MTTERPGNEDTTNQEKPALVLPTFFVLGAAKCGTTTLYEMLRRHPEVYLPVVKEPQFFSNDAHFARGIEHYGHTHFARARARARGDCTPHYLACEKAARRIRDLLPEVSHRFIVILRDPVERAYSLYWNMVLEGVETLSFERALEAENERLLDPELERLGSLRFSYFTSSCFGRQLETWFRYFDPSHFLVLRLDELTGDVAETFARICRFLDISADVPLPATPPANPSGTTRFPGLHRFLRNPHPLKEPIKALLPHELKHRILNLLFAWNKKARAYEPIPPETVVQLRRRFAPDVELLMQVTHEDFRDWLPGPAALRRGSDS